LTFLVDFCLFGGFLHFLVDFGLLVVFWPLERKPPKRSFDLNVVLDSVHFLAFWSDFDGF
jgi:hypothetical protein